MFSNSDSHLFHLHLGYQSQNQSHHYASIQTLPRCEIPVQSSFHSEKSHYCYSDPKLYDPQHLNNYTNPDLQRVNHQTQTFEFSAHNSAWYRLKTLESKMPFECSGRTLGGILRPMVKCGSWTKSRHLEEGGSETQSKKMLLGVCESKEDIPNS